MTKRQKKVVQVQKNYEYKKARGICVVCGQAEAIAGRTRCEVCRARQKENALFAGKREPSPERKEHHRAQERAKYAEDKANGICPMCQKPKPDDGFVSCRPCREKDAFRGYVKRHGVKGEA